MKENNKYAGLFVILVWTIILTIFAYDAYVRLKHDIALMDIKFKSFEEIMNGNP
jgi:hypothetical protein